MSDGVPAGGGLLPPGPVVRAILLRATILWVGIRFALAYLGVVRLTPLSLVVLLGAVVAAVLLDAHHRNETLFLANLGHSRWPVAIVAGAWTLVLELGMIWAVGLVA